MTPGEGQHPNHRNMVVGSSRTDHSKTLNREPSKDIVECPRTDNFFTSPPSSGDILGDLLRKSRGAPRGYPGVTLGGTLGSVQGVSRGYPVGIGGVSFKNTGGLSWGTPRGTPQGDSRPPPTGTARGHPRGSGARYGGLFGDLSWGQFWGSYKDGLGTRNHRWGRPKAGPTDDFGGGGRRPPPQIIFI